MTGLEAAAAQARVPVAVVQLAGLGLREHLVRLDDLAEAVVGVGCVGDVRVQLPRERAERLLDLGLGRVPGDAEQLVVVVFGGGHSPNVDASPYDPANARRDRG